MREVVRLSIVLFIIAGVAALLLGLTNYVTADLIEEQIRMENQLAREGVMSEADEFQEVDADKVQEAVNASGIDNTESVEDVYEAVASGEIVGYTIKTTPSGYGGDISMLTGISVEGVITGVRIISHEETPGLGAKITEESFYMQFNELPFEEPVEVIKSGEPQENQIAAITGATISSQAIVDGTNDAIAVYQELVE